MKKLVCLVSVCLLAMAAAVVSSDRPWMDPQNCDFCKPFMAEKGLMEHMSCDYHNVSSGVISAMTVDKEYAEAYGRAKAGCMKMVASMQKGEKHQMCQYCETLGGLMQAGVKQEEFTSHGVMMTVFTSTDAALVAKMHDWSKKTTEAMAKMANAE